MSAALVLRTITASLEQSGIEYMLTGSFASAHHGAPRSTMDIDLVIAATADQVRAFAQLLPASAYYLELDAALEAHKSESMFNVSDLATGWKVDLIFRKSRPFSRGEFARRKLANVVGLPIFVASVEDVILAKLEWAKRSQSQRQMQDVVSILKLKCRELDQQYIEEWVTALMLRSEWNSALAGAGLTSAGRE